METKQKINIIKKYLNKKFNIAKFDYYDARLYLKSIDEQKFLTILEEINNGKSTSL